MKEETLYVVGMKTYDENGFLIRPNYTFVSGPFETEDVAAAAAKDKMQELLKKYQCICNGNIHFHTLEDKVSFTLLGTKENSDIKYIELDVVPINTKVSAMVSQSLITASVKGRNSKDKDVINRRMVRKAQQVLTTVKVPEENRSDEI